MRSSKNEGISQLSAEVRNIFTDATTRFPRDFANQAKHIVAAHRPAGLPERFQPKLMGQWDDLFAKRQQQERAKEAASQNEAQQPADGELVERRNQERYAQMGRESCRELENILRGEGIDQLVSRAWGIANPSIEHHPQVSYSSEWDTEKNRSRVFISREYKYKGTKSTEGYRDHVIGLSGSSSSYHQGSSIPVENTERDEMGIKYEELVSSHHHWGLGSGPPNQWGPTLTQEERRDLTKGVKVFFVNSDIVPIDHPDARRIFFEYVMAAEERKKERKGK